MNYKSTFIMLVILCHGTALGGERASPYAGQEGRAIKALSADEVQAYLSGDGMGFAKAAELNHYPGPRHVLDLADKLQLSNEQRSRTQAIFNKMKAEAVNLGQQIVEKEKLLDAEFAGGSISDAELKPRLAEIAELQGKIRATHLQAHLAQRQLLTADQIKSYDALRGYDKLAVDGQHGGH
jgi:Spy/CpxP family protein refolding chaperone